MEREERHDLHSRIFWDPGDLRSELHRVAQVCRTCRICANLCPAFLTLLDSGASAGAGPGACIWEPAVDQCYLCQRCLLQCPYAPPHAEQVDVPRLALRAKMQSSRARAGRRPEHRLGNQDLLGALGSLLVPFSNWIQRTSVGRRLLERLLGIHPGRLLPPFHRRTFEAWFRGRARRIRTSVTGEGGKVVFFPTCRVNYHHPQIGRAALQLLVANDVEVVCPPARCCGMPYLENGDVESARANMRANARIFLPYVDRGYRIVTPEASCGLALKSYLPWVEATEGARRVAGAVLDLAEFLLELRARGRLRPFEREGGRYLYHLPCRIKAQGIGAPAYELLRAIPGSSVRMVEHCAGMGGTWGLNRRVFESSLAAGRLLEEALSAATEEVWVSDCTPAGMQILQQLGRRVRHPAEVLRDACGLPATGTIGVERRKPRP